MKFFLLTLLPLLTCMHVTAQSAYEIPEDPEHSAVIFKGQCRFEDLEREPSFSWLTAGAAAYTPVPATLATLAAALPEYELVVLMGTWCEDSQRLIPELYKVLLSIHYPLEKLRMYGVDRQKHAQGDEHKTYAVTRVPTIIVLKDGQERGRITETVEHSIEADLAGIITGGR